MRGGAARRSRHRLHRVTNGSTTRSAAVSADLAVGAVLGLGHAVPPSLLPRPAPGVIKSAYRCCCIPYPPSTPQPPWSNTAAHIGRPMPVRSTSAANDAPPAFGAVPSTSTTQANRTLSTDRRGGGVMQQFDAGTRVRIRRPGPLRNVVAGVQRPVAGGYEVAFFSRSGRPEHAVVHPRWLSIVGDGAAMSRSRRFIRRVRRRRSAC